MKDILKFLQACVMAALVGWTLPAQRLVAAGWSSAETGNVSTNSFSLLYEMTDTAETELQVYLDAEGGTSVNEDLRIEWYPVLTGSVTVPGSLYENRQYRQLLQAQMKARKLLLITVRNALPGQTYYAQLNVREPGTTEWTATTRLAVTTAVRNAFIAESRQIVVDLSAAGTELGGTVLRVSHADSPYPLFAVVGDVVSSARGYVDLGHFQRADGIENAIFDAGESFSIALLGWPATPIAAEVWYTGKFTVSMATTVPFAIGTDAQVVGFVFDPVGNQFVDLPFTITIRAVDEFGNTVPGFGDSVELRASTPALVGGGATPNFTSGILNDHSVTIGESGWHTLQAHWQEGDASSSSDPFLVQDLPGPWELTISVDPVGAATVSAGGTYNHNSLALIEVQPFAGWRFKHWLGENVVAPYVTNTGVLMTTHQHITAVLMPLDPEENYASWALRHFLRNASDPAISGPDRDPNRNGMINLLEYAFGGNPVKSAQPTRQPEFRLAEGQVQMVFYRRVNNPGLSVTIESSVDLSGGWIDYIPAPADLQIVTVATGVEQITVNLPTPPERVVLYRLRVILAE